jgi:hypothetical protein
MMGAVLACAAISLLPGDTALTELCRQVADKTVSEFAAKGLKADQLGITVAALDRSKGAWTDGAYRGDQAMYPASVVKLFYLAYAADRLNRGKLRITPELERGIKDMVVDSSNDATALVVDAITGTSGGPELPPKELDMWLNRRKAVNRWYEARGYRGVNACQKTWNEGPYGRERQGYGPNFENRNSLTPDACVRVMCEIALDKIAAPTAKPRDWSAWMKGLLLRKIPADSKETDYQASAFSGKILPSGATLWSKAGWTSTVRHDVAWVRLPDGREFVWAIFTKSNSENSAIIPFAAGEILAALSARN